MIHQALYPRDEIDRLYVSRKEGGRVCVSIQDSTDVSIQLEDCIKKRGGKSNTDKTSNNRTKTESLQIAAQNNAIRTKYVKARIDKIQQNSRCCLCSDRHEMINHIMSECRKLVQRQYKTKLR